MFYYLKNLFLVLISTCAFQNNAQPPFDDEFDSKYTITIGNKRITPDENVHTYASLKKELANNFYDENYHVLIQFNDAPNIDLKAQMVGKISNELTISKNTYIAAVSEKMNPRKLKKLNVRAILALSPEMKINPAVLQTEEDIVKVNIITSKHLKEVVIFNELEQYDATFKFKVIADSIDKYTFVVEKSKIKSIAKLPWVLQIDEGGMR